LGHYHPPPLQNGEFQVLEGEVICNLVQYGLGPCR